MLRLEPEAAIQGSGSFTPGPWARDKYGNVIGPDGRDILFRGVSILGSGSDKRLAEAEANTAIAAAAPDLLEALIRALDTMEMQERREREEFHIPQAVALGLWSDAKAEMRAAIAKATGS